MNLFDSLHSAAGALDVYQRALSVVQDNVANANTPGYAKQSLNLVARPFDQAAGLAGGVAERGLTSARSEFADDEVRRQLQSLGFFEGQSQAASSVEGLFDVSGTGGVPGGLSQLMQSFSAWSAAPSSADARQSVVAAASNLASSVRATATGLAKVSQKVAGQIGDTVTQINQLANTIQQYNIARQNRETPDPGADANAHAALEQLSQLVNSTTLIQKDGTVSVLLDGGAPLVLGATQYPIAAGQDSSGLPTVVDAHGNDLTAQISGGQLGGLLDGARRIGPQIAASLDKFSEGVAGIVNQALTAGTVSSGNPTPGKPLFQYDSSQGARSLTVDPAFTGADLAAVDASGNANGVPLALASLATSTTAGNVDGQTLGDYFSNIAATAGRESAQATQGVQSQQEAATQTRALRDRISGVSLDEQAVLLMQFQRSYQAAAKMVTTINDMIGDVLNVIR